MTNSTQRRRRTTLLIGMIGLATAATVGLTACGSSNGSTSAHGPDGTSSHGPEGHGPRNPGERGNGVAGTISAENGDNWTITKRDGSTETVTITPTTVFGSTQHPVDRSTLTVGQAIMVEGDTSGTTVTAKRIGQARNRSGSSTAPSAAPTPTS